jgi:hypothetical protein
VPIDDHNVVVDYTPVSLSAGALQFSPTGYSVAENAGSASITVSRSGGDSGTLSIHYATSNGSAVAGADYTAVSGTLTFGPGESSQTFTVPIIDDTVPDPNETVNLTLSSPTGSATLGAPSTAVLTITDNDTTNQIFTVTSAGDDNDGGTPQNPTGADGTLSLREAIELANATAGPNTILFAIGSGAQTINLLSPLPAITDPVVIDGTTQPGYAGAPLIELNGANAGNTSGLYIPAGNSTVKGLVIDRFAYSGIDLETNGGNIIQGKLPWYRPDRHSRSGQHAARHLYRRRRIGQHHWRHGGRGRKRHLGEQGHRHLDQWFVRQCRPREPHRHRQNRHGRPGQRPLWHVPQCRCLR